MGKLLIDVEIRVLFKFIFMVSTLAMEVALPHLLEADMLLLAAHVVTIYLLDIRPIFKKITTTGSQLNALFFY